ncbi:MAG: flagellar hook-basal body complex protein FliE [Bacillota bacterium]|nr:flagellar hook-basal body complex protein FliE [Bacillota bacterium]
MKIHGVESPVKFIPAASGGAEQVEKFSFSSFLSSAIDKVDTAEKVSNALDRQLAAGKLDNLHDAMIAAQKAELTLNLALEVRAQVLDAYRELMRIQV